MKDFPFVSIIIPVYNGEERLPKCLESIRKQSYSQEKIEIIINLHHMIPTMQIENCWISTTIECHILVRQTCTLTIC